MNRLLPLVLWLAPVTGFGQAYFSSNLDSPDLTIQTTADTVNLFGFNYGAFGIPEAPHHVPGMATSGLLLAANIDDPPSVDQIAAVTADLDLEGRYFVQVDIWTNYGIGLEGPTEFAGLSIGHDGSTAGFDGATMIYDGDGGSGSDYRLYKDTVLLAEGDPQYAVGTRDISDPAFLSAFPGQAPPAVQSQAGSAPDGAGGFQWMTLTAEVNTGAMGSGPFANPGTVRFMLASAASHRAVVIGTVDNSQSASPVNLTDRVALVYADVFTSVAGNELLNFGVFDNLIIGPPRDECYIVVTQGGDPTAFCL